VNPPNPGQTPIATDEVFTQQGGYRIGRNAWLSFNASWPLGSLEVRSGQLALCTITRRLVFPVTSVTAISTYYGMFSVGIRIEHTVPEYPRFIVFWSRQPEVLIERLKGAGFPIQ
jgi:hypothetical protein